MNNLIKKADFENFKNRLVGSRIDTMNINTCTTAHGVNCVGVKHYENRIEIQIGGNIPLSVETDDVIGLIEDENGLTIELKNNRCVKFNVKKDNKKAKKKKASAD